MRCAPIQTPNSQTLWDKKQVARYCRVSTYTVDAWVTGRRRGPRFLKVGNLVRFIPSDVFEFLESCARSGNAA